MGKGSGFFNTGTSSSNVYGPDKKMRRLLENLQSQLRQNIDRKSMDFVGLGHDLQGKSIQEKIKQIQRCHPYFLAPNFYYNMRFGSSFYRSAEELHTTIQSYEKIDTDIGMLLRPFEKPTCYEITKKSYQGIIDCVQSIKAKQNFPKNIGGNLFLNLLGGIIGLVYAPLLFVVGILAIPFHYTGYSKNYGSRDFLVSAALYFAESVWNVLSSVVFPLAILWSKYYTDSWNPLQREFKRSLDGILALAKEEIENFTADDLKLASVPM